MRLKLTLVASGRANRDITILCDVTATVGDTARALLRAGASGDPHLDTTALHRIAPVTLRGRAGDGEEHVLLDPCSPIGASGLQSGWTIEPVAEFGLHRATPRLIEAAGYVEVLSGPQTGVVYSLVHGQNTIGRDTRARIHLIDGSVSRRHATVTIGAEAVLEDTGSSNGTLVDGRAVGRYDIVEACTVELGDVALRITLGAPPVPQSDLSHRVMHTRSPRVEPRFRGSRRELPAPSAPSAPTRMPMLAMLAPIMMGGAMYTITRSPMSLMMVAFSPLMMVGAWLDGALLGHRRNRRETLRFEQEIDAEREELHRLRATEIEVRGSESPSLPEVATAIRQRSSGLWTRRPEHRSFLKARFGDGVLPSRTELALPPRGESPTEHWRALLGIEREFLEVGPVPVLERLDRSGSIGVSGEKIPADGLMRSLVLQLAGLHSPAELALVCFAGPNQGEEWDWLKWLPHVDAVTSPIPVRQLADDGPGSLRLITALEGLLETRRSKAKSTVRSHLDDIVDDPQDGESVPRLPVTPAVVVLVLDSRQVDPARLISLAEHGPDAGIHVLWLAGVGSPLPAACRTFAELDPSGARVGYVRTGAAVDLLRPEYVEAPVALGLARRLAPVEDAAARVLDETDLPRAVALCELHSTDLLGGSGPILQAWAASGSLVSRWRAGDERRPVGLVAIVGQGPDGPVSIDLRAHGPHALVGGTSGAGKSEFLQSWIMSLAATISPDRVNFLLVDYKGGAAFAECTDLPHVVGLVTDLSPHLVRRALVSLRAELRHREEALAAHGAKDLLTMESRSEAAAPPSLVIVIDEFAALAAEVPEFVPGIVDIAQRGRSLGLHLILATQRPAGVITGNLRANTNLRVALRMADETDSTDVIGTKDAALFDAGTPGRGAIKIGPGRIGHFQSGYLGGSTPGGDGGPGIEIRPLGFAEGAPWDIPPDPARGGSACSGPVRDIERLRDGIVLAARTANLERPRRPWLDALPEILDLESVRSREHAPVPANPDAAVVGLRDEPDAQRQTPLSIDFEEAGSIAVIGASGSGKTSALLSLAASLSASAASHPVQLYAIDAAGGPLETMRPLPTVGAVAPLSDAELTARVLRRVLALVTERGPRYASARASDLSAYRRTRAGEPRVVLMIDGFAAFRQDAEALGPASGTPLHMLGEIIAKGRSVGVHVVVTSDRLSAIPSAMAAGLQQRYVLRLADRHDYAQLGVPADVLVEAPPGRALIAGKNHEVQFALVDGAEDLAVQAAGLERLAVSLRGRGVQQVPAVLNAPETVPLAALGIDPRGRPAYGIDTRSLEPVGLPARGLGVVSGPAGSGLSTALLACVRAGQHRADHEDHAVERVLLTFAPDGLAEVDVWDRVARGEEEVRETARELAAELGGKRVGPGRAGDSARRTQQQQPAGLIVAVERPAEAEGTEALPELAALAKAARRSRALVLFEFEQGSAGAVWELFAALKQPGWGLALQPDEGETQTPFRESFGRVRQADFPRGRGFAVENGRVTPVQVALPEACWGAPADAREARERALEKG